jgi:hypothetical protein
MTLSGADSIASKPANDVSTPGVLSMKVSPPTLRRIGNLSQGCTVRGA